MLTLWRAATNKSVYGKHWFGKTGLIWHATKCQTDKVSVTDKACETVSVGQIWLNFIVMIYKKKKKKALNIADMYWSVASSVEVKHVSHPSTTLDCHTLMLCSISMLHCFLLWQQMWTVLQVVYMDKGPVYMSICALCCFSIQQYHC